MSRKKKPHSNTYTLKKKGQRVVDGAKVATNSARGTITFDRSDQPRINMNIIFKQVQGPGYPSFKGWFKELEKDLLLLLKNKGLYSPFYDAGEGGNKDDRENAD